MVCAFMSIWTLRILFLILCVLGGYAVSQVQPELVEKGSYGMAIGFGFGGLLIAIDEMLKGFSLRAFSAATFGLMLGTLIAWLVDRSELFVYADERPTRWLIRLTLFVGFSYIGMILAMRSNKEDFSLVIPFVRFSRQNKPDNLLLLDTSVIVDGRIADLIDANFLEGVLVVPKFVMHELHQLSDSADPIKRARGRRGLDMLIRIRKNVKNEVKVHEGDVPEEKGVDAKLVQLARILNAKLFTNDFNLCKIAEVHSVPCVNLNELSKSLKPVILPGEVFSLKIARDGREKGQGIGFLNDGTMVVVNNAQGLVGQQVDIEVQSLHHSGAGVMVFAEVKKPILLSPPDAA